MHPKKAHKILLIPILIFWFGCNEGSKILPKSSGKQGEVLIVCKTSDWQGKLGKALKKSLEQRVSCLPQPEADFKLIQLPVEHFTQALKRCRNIILFNQAATKTGVFQKRDKWAKGQLIISVEADTKETLVEEVLKKGNAIAKAIHQEELKRFGEHSKKYGDREVRGKIEEKMAIKVNMPKGYNLAKDQENLLWLRSKEKRTQKGTQHLIEKGLLFFSYPLDGEINGQVMLTMRDSILRSNIPGPKEGTYMATSYRGEQPFIELLELENNKAMLTRGLWRIEGGFMGGPFIDITFIQAEKKRVIHISGYVYAPGFNKREMIRELEAILLSSQLS